MRNLHAIVPPMPEWALNAAVNLCYNSQANPGPTVITRFKWDGVNLWWWSERFQDWKRVDTGWRNYYVPAKTAEFNGTFE